MGKVLIMVPKNIIRAVGILAAGVLATGLAACASQPEAAATSEDGLTTVRINQAFQSLLYLPLYVAEEAGFFEEQGIDMKISTGGGGTQSWSAVLGGSADFSIQDPVFVPKSLENGGEGVVVASIQDAPTVFIIGKDAASVQDDPTALEGKRVVTSPEPDTSWAFMTKLIEQYDLQDVTIVNVALGNELAAVESGQADYALAVDPQVSQGVIEMGLNSVYSFSADPDWYPFAFSSLTTTQKFIDTNPEAAQAVVTAFEQASRFIYSDFEGTVDIAMEYFPELSREVVAQAVKNAIDAKGYPEHVLITEEAWDHNMEIALSVGNLKAYPSDNTSYEATVNTELAQKAREWVDSQD
jgi:NitT/TauT family transport system substrate-binding protein